MHYSNHNPNISALGGLHQVQVYRINGVPNYLAPEIANPLSQLALPESLRNVAKMVAGYIIHHLQNKANDRPWFRFLYMELTNHGQGFHTSPAFYSMVEYFTYYVDMIQAENEDYRENTNAAIDQLVPVLLNVMGALKVARNPALRQQCDIEGVLDEAEQLRGEWVSDRHDERVRMYSEQRKQASSQSHVTGWPGGSNRPAPMAAQSNLFGARQMGGRVGVAQQDPLQVLSRNPMVQQQVMNVMMNEGIDPNQLDPQTYTQYFNHYLTAMYQQGYFNNLVPPPAIGAMGGTAMGGAPMGGMGVARPTGPVYGSPAASVAQPYQTVDTSTINTGGFNSGGWDDIDSH